MFTEKFLYCVSNLRYFRYFRLFNFYNNSMNSPFVFYFKRSEEEAERGQISRRKSYSGYHGGEI